MPNVDTVVHGGRKVPEAFECEMGDDAPIWKLYTEQATQHDEPMLRAWNSSIDTLLIFVTDSTPGLPSQLTYRRPRSFLRL